VKILEKNFFGYLSKKIGSAYAQSPWKCSNFEILAKIERKEANFVRKFTKGIYGFALGPKKIQNYFMLVYLQEIFEAGVIMNKKWTSFHE
jgi:hypothetical protein